MKKLSYLFIGFLTFSITGCGFDSRGTVIHRYDHPRKALLVLDVQKDFTEAGGKMPVRMEQVDGMMKNINNLVDAAQQRNIQIIYIRNIFPKSACIQNYFRNNAAVEHSAGIDFDSRLTVIGNTVFSKNQPDAFSNPEFEIFLTAGSVDELYITGVYADQCVYWTSKAALNRGYKLIFIRDAVAARTEKDIASASDRIRKAGADVSDTRSVIRLWNR